MMFAQSAPIPRSHLTAAAKAIALAAIKQGRSQVMFRSVQADADQPLVNRFGRRYLPIDRGIPLPSSLSPKTARPFKLMAVGKSFFEPCGTVPNETLAARIKMDAKDSTPAKFELAPETQNGQLGQRVWRVK